MDTINLHDKIDNLPPALIEEVSHYVDFLLEKAMSVKKKKVREFGSLQGKITISEDFNEPLADFKDYM